MLNAEVPSNYWTSIHAHNKETLTYDKMTVYR